MYFMEEQVVIDCGVVQADALTVDPVASLEMVRSKFLRGTEILSAEIMPISIYYLHSYCTITVHINSIFPPGLLA